MNVALSFLEDNRQRSGSARYGIGKQSTAVLLTPRFRASRHVLFLVLAEGKAEPALVVKIPRLPAEHEGLRREAANLHAARSGSAMDPESIPQVVACEPYRGRMMLAETVLTGLPMAQALVRRRPAECCRMVLDWLAALPGQGGCGSGESGCVSRLIHRPLEQFAASLRLSMEEHHLLEQTQVAVSTLREAAFPSVFEHGDLSHPNLLILRSGALGVIDWELAEPQGLPAQDLFFFLTYVAFAGARADSTGHYIGAFHLAFFGPSAWARPYVLAYARRLGLPVELLTALFVACWARRATGLADRLLGAPGAAEELDPESIAWLRANRYYSLWRHTVVHLGELKWCDAAGLDKGDA